MGWAMKVGEAIEGLRVIRGILTKKERCFSDVMAKRTADGRGLTDEEVLTVVRLLRKYGISIREDGGRSLAVDQDFWHAGVEPHHPVPDGLQPDAADLRGFSPRAAIVDLG